MTPGLYSARVIILLYTGKLGSAYLHVRYQNRQQATRFPFSATPAMLAISVLTVKWKAPQVFIIEGALYWRGIGGPPMSLAGPGQPPRGEGLGLSPPEASRN